MRTLSFLLLLILSAAAALAETAPLRLPRGEKRAKAGGETVNLGFGTVSFPAPPQAGPRYRAGERLACNRGTFSLRYALRQEGARVRARDLSVRVANAAEYFAERHTALEEHERGHQRINAAAAPDIQGRLSAFSAPGRDLKAAEASLREAFRRELDAIENLHRDWDATSVLAGAPEKKSSRPPSEEPPPNPPSRRKPAPKDFH
jgi:hypothetical protein